MGIARQVRAVPAAAAAARALLDLEAELAELVTPLLHHHHKEIMVVTVKVGHHIFAAPAVAQARVAALAAALAAQGLHHLFLDHQLPTLAAAVPVELPATAAQAAALAAAVLAELAARAVLREPRIAAAVLADVGRAAVQELTEVRESLYFRITLSIKMRL